MNRRWKVIAKIQIEVPENFTASKVREVLDECLQSRRFSYIIDDDIRAGDFVEKLPVAENGFSLLQEMEEIQRRIGNLESSIDKPMLGCADGALLVDAETYRIIRERWAALDRVLQHREDSTRSQHKRSTLNQLLWNQKRGAVLSTLEKTSGNKAAAARLLGINRTTLVEFLRRMTREGAMENDAGRDL